MPSGSIATTFRRLCDFTARPSIDRLRVIAGSVRWWKRSCCSSPPRMRTFHLPSPAVSTTNGKPSRRQANVVQSMIVGIGVADPDDAAAE